MLMTLMLPLLLAGCADVAGEKAATPALVKLIELKSGRLADDVAADGQVTALKLATVSSVASGRIVKIAAKVGDRVEAGQPLIWVEDPLAPSNIRRMTASVDMARVRVESARITTAQSADQKSASIEQGAADVQVAAIAVEKARTTVAAAQTELTRKKDLLTKKAIAETDVEKARLTRDQAQADLRSAEVSLVAAKEKLTATRADLSVDLQRTQEGESLASLRQAEADLESALTQQTQDIVRSPITGIVAESNARLGQYPAEAGGPLMSISDQSSLRVQARFDERYSSLIRTGLRAEGRAVTQPDQMIPLLVERVTPQSKESLVAVDFVPVGGNGPRLTADSYVRVRLSLDYANGLLVPVGAITWNQRGVPSVMIVKDNIAKQHVIEILDQDESQALVKEAVIKAGDQLIVEGQTGLTDGARVIYHNE